MRLVILALVLGAVHSFDGTGTFTSEADLNAFLADPNATTVAPVDSLGTCDAAVVTTNAELQTLANCRVIRGSLVIEDSTDITNLDVLSNLEEIDVSAGGSQHSGCTYGLIIRNNAALAQWSSGATGAVAT